MTKMLRLVVVGLGASVCGWAAVSLPPALGAQPNTGVISGVVTSSHGPEAGVWVIAETDDLQTKFRKIVVTDDRGRYVVPELPEANYDVWVRGYGLADSVRVSGRPGQELPLQAVVARTPQEAAKVYPANYWASLLQPPARSEFPGTGPEGNGIGTTMRTQSHWLSTMKSCQRCHQIGSEATRTVPDRDRFESTTAAWDDRVQRGQRGAEMNAFMTRFGRARGLQMYADWSDRIAKGEVPPAPPRPQGVERNVVITMWNWGDNVGLVHDEMTTDRRNPRLNASGKVYATDWTNDFLLIADPVAHTSSRVKVPLRAPRSEVAGLRQSGFKPYRHFGDRAIWDNPGGTHNPMMDAAGRVWITTTIRGPQNPAWCRDGSLNTFAQYFPLATSGKQAGYFDPKTQRFTLIDTCVGTHHLQFAEDANNTLYFSSPGGPALGWLNTKIFDQTGDEKLANGWCPLVLDTNGDGRITKPWNEPALDSAGPLSEDMSGGGQRRQPRATSHNPKLDSRIDVGGGYGVIVNPVDGSVWVSTDEVVPPGQIFRVAPGKHPPESCVTERYMLPGERAFRPRGIDVDRNGVIWTALAGSAAMASFDRRKCKVLNGPRSRDGRHCDEGWTFYPEPGPTYKGTDIGTDFSYYNWVDQFDTLGLGANTPIANGSGSDSLLVLKPATGEWIVMRVPYPMGFHSRGVDGRIDDPNTGWKGRGVYSTYGADAAWHVEGGPNERGNLVKFQIRPDPLAR
jgi:hypothetical protein